jgi:hypothetical protein
VRLDDSAGDVEPEAAAATIAFVLLPVAIEDVGQVIGGNAGTAVLDREVDLAGELLGHHRDRSAARGEFDRVADQVRKHPKEQVPLAPHRER